MAKPFACFDVTGIGQIVLYKGRFYFPTNATGQRVRVITTAHDHGGHAGIYGTLEALRAAHVGWPTLHADVASYIASCPSCQRFKAPDSLGNTGTSEPTTATAPRHTLYVDFLGRLPQGGYVILAIDMFSRYMFLRAASSTASSSLIRAIDSITEFTGYPRILRVDRGSGNISKELNRWAESHSIELVPSPPFAHFTLGMVENRVGQVRDLAHLLFGTNGTGAAAALSSQANLNLIANVANRLVNRSTGYSAYEVFFGTPSPTPVDELTGAAGSPIFNSPDDFINCVHALHDLVATASSASQLINAKGRSQRSTPPPTYAAGDLVLMWYPKRDQFDIPYHGPFIIDSRRNDNWYLVRRLVDQGIHDAKLTEAHVSRLRRFNASRTTIDALLAFNLDSSFGIVSAITGHGVDADGNAEFHVLWADGTTSRSPAELLTKVKVFQDYVATHGITLPSGRAGPRASGRARTTV